MTVSLFDWIMSPLLYPMYHADQDIRGDVVPIRDPSRRSDPGGLPHVPNLSGARMVSVHMIGEFHACIGVAAFGGLAPPLGRPPLAVLHTAP